MREQTEWQSGFEAGKCATLAKVAELLVVRMFDPYASPERRDEVRRAFRELEEMMESDDEV